MLTKARNRRTGLLVSVLLLLLLLTPLYTHHTHTHTLSLSLSLSLSLLQQTPQGISKYKTEKEKRNDQISLSILMAEEDI